MMLYLKAIKKLDDTGQQSIVSKILSRITMQEADNLITPCWIWDSPLKRTGAKDRQPRVYMGEFFKRCVNVRVALLMITAIDQKAFYKDWINNHKRYKIDNVCNDPKCISPNHMRLNAGEVGIKNGTVPAK